MRPRDKTALDRLQLLMSSATRVPAIACHDKAAMALVTTNAERPKKDARRIYNLSKTITKKPKKKKK